MTCGGSEISGIIEEHSENIERTGDNPMGELVGRAIETAVEERKSRGVGY
jgi:hypothetical protein